MSTAMEMPRYQCHKQVWALKIKEVKQSDPGVIFEGGSWEIVPEDSRYGDIRVSHEYYCKHKPEAGGYFVVYDDGYKSFSPAKAFEDGYTLPKVSTFKERVTQEEAELSEKLNKLGEFIHGNVFKTLAEEDRALLQEQDDHMRSYVGVLRKRIARFGT
jgi:hypothetical protein